MQTLTKRKESIVKQLSKSDSLFFQLEVDPLFSEEKEVVSFFEKEDDSAFEAIASKYVQVSKELPEDCDCGGTIEWGDDHRVCDTCGKISMRIEGSDLLRTRVSSYDRKSKFLACLRRFQARQDVVLDTSLYEKYLSRHYGDLTKVTKKQVFLMLVQLGREKDVENLHLIHHEVTGVPPTNIRHLESVLLQDFEHFVRYSKRRFRVRQVFYHLLKERGIPCCKEEFGLTKEPSIS